jgi:hypothetical protein
MKHPETEFMVAPVLEHYFNLMRPAMMIPLDELLSGESPKLNECRKFVRDLANHPVRTWWEQKAEDFRKITERAGYMFTKTDYRDLPTIAPVIADAVTAFESYQSSQILQLRDGAPSMQQPILLDEVGVFTSIAEAVQTLEQVPVPAFIGFFGIEKTYGMGDDSFEIYLHGHSTRKNNLMCNGRMTEEEYQITPDPYSRKMYCIIRDGENIYIFQPRLEQSHYECLSDKDTFINYYDRRGTWAPIQVFFKGVAPAAEGTTSLIPYRKKLWALREILDEEQKVWVPIFFTTVKNKFFGDIPVEAIPAVAVEETQVTLQLPDNDFITNLPAVTKNTLAVPSAEDLFSREDNPAETMNIDERRDRYYGALTMMRWLGVTAADIADAPLTFVGAISIEAAQKEVDRRAIQAYYKAINKKLIEKHKARQLPIFEAQQWYHGYIENHLDEIIADTKAGTFGSFAKITVDKQPVLNPDGTVKTYQPTRWSTEVKPVLSATDIDDGKLIRRYGDRDIHEYRSWFPITLIDKRPPVTVKIYPQTPEDIAKICRCTVDDLPEAIRYKDFIAAFNHDHIGGIYTITLNFSKTEAKKRNIIDSPGRRGETTKSSHNTENHPINT